MFGGQNREKFLELSPGSTAPGDDGGLASSTWAEHISRIAAEAGFHIEHGRIHLYQSDWSPISGAGSPRNIGHA